MRKLIVIVITLLITTEMFAEFSRDTEKQIVIDSTTGLIWQDDNATKAMKLNLADANKYCETLTHAGYSDWRLPSIEELQTITDYSRFNSALKSPFVNFAFLYWSSTPYGNSTDFVWSVHAWGGSINGRHAPYSECNTRCVRGSSFNSFTSYQRSGFKRDDNIKIVTDTKQNLQWQDDETIKSTTKKWIDAVSYCKELRLGKFDDWRLPSIKELQSIADYSRSYPALNSAFINFTLDRYWSSSVYVLDEGGAWGIGTNTGVTNYHKKADELGVRCLRGGYADDTSPLTLVSPYPANMSRGNAGTSDEEHNIMVMESVSKTLSQAASNERVKLRQVIERGNDFIMGYYGGGVHEAAARWWYQRYNEDDGAPLGTVTDTTPWWGGDDVAISGQKIHQILNFKSVMDGNLPSGCPNIHLADISQNKNRIVLRYEILAVGTFYDHEQKFDAEHHGEIWVIELSFNQENKMDDIRFLVGSDIQSSRQGLLSARSLLMFPLWLDKKELISRKKAINEMEQASSICNSY